jgi:hypothetical protein
MKLDMMQDVQCTSLFSTGYITGRNTLPETTCATSGYRDGRIMSNCEQGVTAGTIRHTTLDMSWNKDQKIIGASTASRFNFLIPIAKPG